MQPTILNLIVNAVVFVAGATTVVVGCIHANRTVKEGVRNEAARRRALSDGALGA